MQVEFKSTSSGTSSPDSLTHHSYTSNVISSPSGASTGNRTGSTLLLFEEFIPAVLVSPKRKSQLPLPFASTLSNPKSKAKWKQAAALNHVPCILGQVPTTSTLTLLGGRGKKEREREFEGLLEQTKSVPSMTLRIAADSSRSERGGSKTPIENIAGVGANPGTSSGRQVGGGTGATRKGVSSPLY
jgi:hypothetical protein